MDLYVLVFLREKKKNNSEEYSVIYLCDKWKY